MNYENIESGEVKVRGLKQLKKILIIFILTFIFGINVEVKATTNDTNMVTRIYDGVFAIQKYKNGGSRIYYAQSYNMLKDNKIEIGYCIQLGEKLGSNIYTSTNDYSLVGLSKENADYVRLVAYYGYNYNNHYTYKYYLAAQELIWEKLGDDEIYWTSEEDANGSRVDVEKEKKEISQLVDKHYTQPDFDKNSISYGITTELKDKNNILNEYQIVSVTNATHSVSSNTIKLTPTSLDDITINLKRKLAKNYTNKEMFFYSPISQNIVSTGVVDDCYKQIKIKNNGIKIKVNKKDAVTGELVKIKGISFKIYDVDNQKYVCQNDNCEISTNDEGVAVSLELPIGNYKLEEVDKKIDGYLYNHNSIDFKVHSSNIVYDKDYGSVIEVDFHNQKPTGTLIIDKKGEVMISKDNSLSYQPTELENIEFSVITNQDIYYKETKIQKGEPVEIIKTDKNGIAKLEGLPLGSYTVKETLTNSLYILDEQEYNVEFEYKDQYSSVITQTLSIKNYLKKGELKFRKIDSNTKEGLQDVVIALYDQNNNKIYESKTDNNGNIYIKNLAYGNYYLKEITPLEGYYQNNDILNFKIDDNTKIAEVVMENAKIEQPPKTSNIKLSILSTISMLLIITFIIHLMCNKVKNMI